VIAHQNVHTGQMAPGSPPSSKVRVHELAGGPQVAWHSDAESAPPSPAVASGSASGRGSLASKSHVQLSTGTPGAQAVGAMTAAPTTSDATTRTMS
jgi:hypothetical protein